MPIHAFNSCQGPIGGNSSRPSLSLFKLRNELDTPRRIPTKITRKAITPNNIANGFTPFGASGTTGPPAAAAGATSLGGFFT